MSKIKTAIKVFLNKPSEIPKLIVVNLTKLGVLNCMSDKNYKGVHLLVFEKTNPEDGKIFWNHKEISKADLIKKLKFE
jgi:hypothetical protein